MSELAGGGSYCHTLWGAAAQAFRNRHGWSKPVVQWLMDVRIDRRRELSSHPPGCCHACVELCGNSCESPEVNADYRCVSKYSFAQACYGTKRICVCLFAEACCGTKKICVCLFAETRCGTKKICVCLFTEKCYGTKKICVCLFHVCHGAELSDSTLACIILAQFQVYLPLTNEKLMTFVSRLVGRKRIIFTPSGVLFSKVPTKMIGWNVSDNLVKMCATPWRKTDVVGTWLRKNCVRIFLTWTCFWGGVSSSGLWQESRWVHVVRKKLSQQFMAPNLQPTNWFSQLKVVVGLRVLPLIKAWRLPQGQIVDRCRSWKPPRSPRFRGLFGCTCPVGLGIRHGVKTKWGWIKWFEESFLNVCSLHGIPMIACCKKLREIQYGLMRRMNLVRWVRDHIVLQCQPKIRNQWLFMARGVPYYSGTPQTKQTRGGAGVFINPGWVALLYAFINENLFPTTLARGP